MSRLILVRHAQATFSTDRSRAFQDYDQLSSLGRTQSEALGEELAASGIRFDHVFVGPATRHRQTADAVGAVYRRLDWPWPDPETSTGLGEHVGATVVDRALSSPHFVDDRNRLATLEAAGAPARDLHRAFFEVFRRVTRQWARGELPEGLAPESWQAFRERVSAAVEEILGVAQRGAIVAAFTSGGPIGSTVAAVLGLSDEQALELAWILQNATLTELLFTSERVSLKSFNVQPRLGSPELFTYV